MDRGCYAKWLFALLGTFFVYFTYRTFVISIFFVRALFVFHYISFHAKYARQKKLLWISTTPNTPHCLHTYFSNAFCIFYFASFSFPFALSLFPASIRLFSPFIRFIILFAIGITTINNQWQWADHSGHEQQFQLCFHSSLFSSLTKQNETPTENWMAKKPIVRLHL